MLSDAKVRAAKPQEKAYKLTDSGQLYLFVSPAGARIWRMNYKFGTSATGKAAQKTLTIGAYPAFSLKDAREARDQAKAHLARGIEPTPANVVRAPCSEGNTGTQDSFKVVALRWHTLQKKRWSIVHAQDVLDSLETHVFAQIGDMRLNDIKGPKLLDLVTGLADRGAIETAHRIRQRISAIFVYGMAIGLAEADPAASLAVALPSKPKAKKQPAITDLDDLRKVLADCDAERCRGETKLALRLLALTAVRPGELRMARWAEFEDLDGEAPLWRIPSARMKGDKDRKAEENGDHLVPLAPQAIEVLKVMRSITGEYDLVFPNERYGHRPISENTLRALLIRAGYYQLHVPHGFRAAFSTIMNERAERAERAGDRAVIDLMLAHVPANKVEGAYNRAAYMARRRELAEEWADLLLEGRAAPAALIGLPMRWAATGPGRGAV